MIAGLELGSGVGLGFGGDYSLRKSDDNVGGDEEDDNSFLPTAFGRKIKEGAQRRERVGEVENGEEKFRREKGGWRWEWGCWSV